MRGNPKIKMIGLFGQSGAGKTTVIRNVKTPINGHVVGYNTGIIRYLFQKNGDYQSPMALLRQYNDELSHLKDIEKENKLDEIIEKYIRSQLQLLNDFSTEVFINARENTDIQKYMLLDRSPIDFYALTVCGLKYLSDKINKEPSGNALHLLALLKKTAEQNTRNFFTSIIITKPWKQYPSSEDRDGVRDEYLSAHFVGSNWYDRFAECDIGDCKVFTVPETMADLMARAKLVGEFLGELK
jgi:hypothetical protein